MLSGGVRQSPKDSVIRCAMGASVATNLGRALHEPVDQCMQFRRHGLRHVLQELAELKNRLPERCSLVGRVDRNGLQQFIESL